MAGLKAKLDQIADIIPSNRPVALLDVPVHHNVGDLLIALGTRRWLESRGYEIAVTACLHNRLDATLRRISDDMTIVCHGGGNFGDLYPMHQRFREALVEARRQNRIVLLPQTVYYANPAGMRHAAEIYARHPDLHILLRDDPSFDLVRRATPNPTYLFPDMAHFLWDMPEFPNRNPKAAGDFNIARTDTEAVAANAEGFVPGIQPVDWDDLIPPFGFLTQRIAARQFAHDRSGTMHGWANALWQAHEMRVLRHTVARFGAAETVTTSRLHGLILACLLGKRVRVVENSYGKLQRYQAAWLSECDTIEITGERYAA